MIEDWISLREFARRREVALSAVQKAIATGRVTSVKRDERGRVVGIEANQATDEWNRNTDPVEAFKSGKILAPPSVQTSGQAFPSLQLEPPPAPPVAKEKPTAPDDDGGYYESRAKREKFAALTAERDYLEAIGRLVSVDELREVSFRRYRAIRDKLLNIPDRVAAILAAEKDPARVHTALTAEIKRVLHELSDDAHAGAAGRTEERVAA